MNREAERKKLVELIENFFEKEIGASFVKGFLDKFAENILDDGWMRPPVKVGDKLYTTYCYGINDWRIEESVVYEVRQRIGTGLEIFEMRRSENGTFSYFKVELDKFGKTVFTSREDAEQALKGSAGE